MNNITNINISLLAIATDNEGYDQIIVHTPQGPPCSIFRTYNILQEKNTNSPSVLTGSSS
jgi:hypothetical protein